MIGLIRASWMRVALVLAAVSILTLVASPGAVAQSPSADELSEREKMLVEEIKKQILEDLLKDGALNDQIEAGIERYVEKQKKAQAEARSRQEQLAAAVAADVRPVSPQRDHIYGNPKAEVSLIEYSDFECPYCKTFHKTAKQVVDSFDGRVNWVYRHFPLAFHNPGAQKQAEASECASALGGDDAFWRYADEIFERTRSNGNGFPLDGLVPLAEELGLDADEFRACLETGKSRERVLEDYEEGIEIGISGTPGNILRNNVTGKVMVRAGALPAADLKEALTSLLE